MRNQRGSVLAETAVLLPVFVLLIYCLYDAFHVSEAVTKNYIEARNAAWRGESGGTFEALMKILKFEGGIQDGFDMYAQTQHGTRTDTVKTYVLPRTITESTVWIDRYVWSVNIGIDDFVNKIFGMFDGRDKKDYE